MLLGVSGLAWVLLVYPNEPHVGQGRVIALEVAPGTPARVLARTLEARGVIDHAWLFSMYMRLLHADESLRAGTVQLTDRLTPSQLLRRLSTGFGEVDTRVLIPEGFNRFDIAVRLETFGICSAQGFLDATTDRGLLDRLDIPGPSAESYLFPGTYDFRSGSAPSLVVARMVDNERARTAPLWASEGMRRLHDELGWGPYQVLTLASIVEREAAVPEERPIIAGVFLNRLRSTTFQPRARLQADPTAAYGCLVDPKAAPSCAGYDGVITPAMLADPANPYNTYRHSGLPPGPIANPGLPAIEAVLEPAHHDYLYFVARGDGRHTFSETLVQHNRAIERGREAKTPP